MENTALILEYLNEHATEKARAFSEKLIPTKNKILGLTSPDMKAIIKRTVRGEFGDPIEVLAKLPDDCYETLAVQGGIITGIKTDIETRKKLIAEFVPKIDNWATNDSFVSGCKFIAKDLDAWYDFLKNYCESDNEFSIRFGVIALMAYYLVDAYIGDVLDVLQKVSYDAYYVKMAVAWGLATALAKQYAQTLPVIEGKTLDKWTHNKSIQKAVESYRITDEQKAYLKTLKIK